MHALFAHSFSVSISVQISFCLPFALSIHCTRRNETEGNTNLHNAALKGSVASLKWVLHHLLNDGHTGASLSLSLSLPSLWPFHLCLVRAYLWVAFFYSIGTINIYLFDLIHIYIYPSMSTYVHTGINSFLIEFCTRSFLKPAEINKVNKLRRTPLHEAARANQVACAGEILALMKSTGSDVNAIDENVSDAF